MITLPFYHRKKVGVFGLGKAGEAAIKSLLASGAEAYVWDDGEAGRAGLAKRLPQARVMPLDEWPWGDLSGLVLSPGVPFTHPAPHPVVRMAQKHNVEIVGDVELLFRAQPQARYVGITGTNGKSTTTTLVAHILCEAGKKVQVGGNLGTPALALDPLGAEGIYVLEMSSYQLDLTSSVRFHAAALLNLTPDHLDRHGDMQGYLSAKLRIFAHQHAGDVAVVGEEVWQEAGGKRQEWGRARRVLVSLGNIQDAVCVENGLLQDHSCPLPPASCPISLREITTLQGRHNWQNAGVAYALCRACEVEPEVIAEAMQTFPGLAHRMEFAGDINGVRYINDSKATNADATANALAAYDDIYWIAGGKAKAGGIEPLSEFFPKIRHAFLIGDAAEAFALTLKDVPHSIEFTLERAVQAAFAMVKPGSVVLLSPACASFDQFKNFEERGDDFKRHVATLAHITRHAS